VRILRLFGPSCADLEHAFPRGALELSQVDAKDAQQIRSPPEDLRDMRATLRMAQEVGEGLG
jgi:hypothetical protein